MPFHRIYTIQIGSIALRCSWMMFAVQCNNLQWFSLSVGKRLLPKRPGFWCAVCVCAIKYDHRFDMVWLWCHSMPFAWAMHNLNNFSDPEILLRHGEIQAEIPAFGLDRHPAISAFVCVGKHMRFPRTTRPVGPMTFDGVQHIRHKARVVWAHWRYARSVTDSDSVGEIKMKKRRTLRLHFGQPSWDGGCSYVLYIFVHDSLIFVSMPIIHAVRSHAVPKCKSWGVQDMFWNAVDLFYNCLLLYFFLCNGLHGLHP